MNRPTFNRIRFGVNYVPSREWWYCWNDFRAEDIAPDLDAIASMGADHLRIMLIWPFLQPNRATVSTAHLDRLEQLMTLARDRGLDVYVTALTGWLSGWSFRPNFDRPTEFFDGQSMREPVETYIRACAERLNKHPNFLGFDLGNELNCCWQAPTTEIGDAWMNWALDLCETVSPQASHVNGVDHQPWFYPETFSAEALAKRPELITIHSWIEFTGAMKRGTFRDPACTRLAPAMAALARAYAGEAAKPVWLQEFGSCYDWIGREEVPGFLEESVHASIAGGINWITWWCSHDIHSRFEFPVIEYDMGLIDLNNKLKPAGLVFQKMAREYGGKPVASAPTLDLPPLPIVDRERSVTFENTWQWLEAVQKQLI